MNPVQKALWFVESHSREEITLEDIARVCEVSAYHLTRAFAATMGVPLMRYVRGRRLTEAARQLARGADDILSVALEAGYGSHEAFTRAFRDQFGLTPEQARARGHLSDLPLMEAIAMSMTPVPTLAPPRFETLGSVRLAGLVERYGCQASQGIPEQWQRFGPYLGHVCGQVGEAAYGASFNFDGDGNFDYLCGVEVNGVAAPPRDLAVLELAPQRYAVFTHSGHVAGIRATCAAIWNDWFPSSGCQAVQAPMFERYGPEFNPLTGLGGFEIWIPVQR